MDPFSPFNYTVIACYGISLVAFYLLGAVFFKDHQTFRETGIRLGIGTLAFVVLNAIVHAGLGSGLIVFTPFLILLLNNRLTSTEPGRSVPIKSRGYRFVTLLFVAAAVYGFESYRMDLRINETEIYVGNTDISFYSGHGQMMYRFCEETLASSVSSKPEKVLYHFSDLWFSGFYSHYFEITPYYAYGLLYRSLLLTAVIFLLLSLMKQRVGWLMTFLLTSITLLLTNSPIAHVSLSDMDILKPFSSNWPLYAESSYLMPMLVVALTLHFLSIKQLVYPAFTGLFLLGAVHSSFIVPTFIASLLLLIIILLRQVWPNVPKLLPDFTLSKILLLSLFGVGSYLYALWDGRSFPLPIESITQVGYLSIHTSIRVLLTLACMLPIVISIIYFFRQSEFNRHMLLLLVYLSGVIGFIILFAIFQSSNSTKLFTAINSVILFPLLALGAAKMVSSEKRSLVNLGRVAVVVLTLFLLLGTRSSNLYQLVYSWETIPGYVEQHTFQRSEVEVLRKEMKGSLAGFAICDELNYSGGLIRYNEFIDISSLIPNFFVFRLNALEKDFRATKEGLSWVKKSAPAQFWTENTIINQEGVRNYAKFLQLEYLIFEDKHFCGPNQLEISVLSTHNSIGTYRAHKIISI